MKPTSTPPSSKLHSWTHYLRFPYHSQRSDSPLQTQTCIICFLQSTLFCCYATSSSHKRWKRNSITQAFFSYTIRRYWGQGTHSLARCLGNNTLSIRKHIPLVRLRYGSLQRYNPFCIRMVRNIVHLGYRRALVEKSHCVWEISYVLSSCFTNQHSPVHLSPCWIQGSQFQPVKQFAAS